MFQNASSFNYSLNSWDLQDLVFMMSMFADATSFNQPVDSWIMPKVSSFNNLFNGATALDQSLAAWDVTIIGNMTGMLTGVTLSQTIYSETLISWGNQSVSPGVVNDITFDAGNSVHDGSAAAIAAKGALTDGGGPTWTINDGM